MFTKARHHHPAWPSVRTAAAIPRCRYYRIGEAKKPGPTGRGAACLDDSEAEMDFDEPEGMPQLETDESDAERRDPVIHDCQAGNTKPSVISHEQAQFPEFIPLEPTGLPVMHAPKPAEPIPDREVPACQSCRQRDPIKVSRRKKRKIHGIIFESSNGTGWLPLLARLKTTSAHVVFSQEHRVTADLIPEYSSQLADLGWKSVWPPCNFDLLGPRRGCPLHVRRRSDNGQELHRVGPRRRGPA